MLTVFTLSIRRLPAQCRSRSLLAATSPVWIPERVDAENEELRSHRRTWLRERASHGLTLRALMSC